MVHRKRPSDGRAFFGIRNLRNQEDSEILFTNRLLTNEATKSVVGYAVEADVNLAVLNELDSLVAGLDSLNIGSVADNLENDVAYVEIVVSIGDSGFCVEGELYHVASGGREVEVDVHTRIRYVVVDSIAIGVVPAKWCSYR